MLTSGGIIPQNTCCCFAFDSANLQEKNPSDLRRQSRRLPVLLRGIAHRLRCPAMISWRTAWSPTTRARTSRSRSDCTACSCRVVLCSTSTNGTRNSTSNCEPRRQGVTKESKALTGDEKKQGSASRAKRQGDRGCRRRAAQLAPSSQIETIPTELPTPMLATCVCSVLPPPGRCCPARGCC
jgi:hypothetical protein